MPSIKKNAVYLEITQRLPKLLCGRFLKGDKLLGTRWRRQFSVGPYILDFYCPSLKLAIELDGALHYTDSGYHHDSVRENFLSDLGIEVLRFENKTVWNGQEAIIESVTRKIEERLKNSPSKLEGVPFRGRECVNGRINSF